MPGEAPPQAFSRVMAPYFCPECRGDFPRIEFPACSHCGREFEYPDGGAPLCVDCRSRPRHLGRVRSFGVYDGSLRIAVHQLKYRSRTPLAGPLGKLLFDAFLRHWPEADVDLVAPVPLHRRKFRQRGFNQAFLLIGKWPALAAEKGLSFPREMIRKSVLERIRWTPSQVGMNRDSRRTNLRQAFAMGGGVDVSGKRVLLVDDVYTTGATADECAGTLRSAGAARVDVLTLAQTVQKR